MKVSLIDMFTSNIGGTWVGADRDLKIEADRLLGESFLFHEDYINGTVIEISADSVEHFKTDYSYREYEFPGGDLYVSRVTVKVSKWNWKKEVRPHPVSDDEYIDDCGMFDINSIADEIDQNELYYVHETDYDFFVRIDSDPRAYIKEYDLDDRWDQLNGCVLKKKNISGTYRMDIAAGDGSGEYVTLAVREAVDEPRSHFRVIRGDD